MKWRRVLGLVVVVFLLVGTTTMAEGASVCPSGNVKYEIGGGYEYNDGSGWIEGGEFRVCWGANEGYRVIGVCIYVGGPDKGSRQISLGPGDGCWNNPEKYGISHVVLYTESIPEPTPTKTPIEPTPTEVFPTETPEPTATPTSTPTSTPSSTPTATPTATPTDPPPTPTEVAPTQTPEPTSTSEPTPTDAPPPESTSTPKPTDKPKTPVSPTEEPLPTPNGLPSTGGQAEPNSPSPLMVIVLAGGAFIASFVLRRRKI